MWCFTSSLMLQQCKQQEDYRKSLWWLFSLFGLFLSCVGFHCVPKHVDQQEQVAWLVRWHRIVLFCPLSWNQPAHNNECTVVCCFETLFVLEHDTSIWKRDFKPKLPESNSKLWHRYFFEGAGIVTKSCCQQTKKHQEVNWIAQATQRLYILWGASAWCGTSIHGKLESFCKNMECFMHKSSSKGWWADGYGTGLECFLHTLRGA